MTVRVRYLAQLRQAAGCSLDQADLPDGASVADLLGVLAGRRPGLRGVLFTEGRVQPTVLIFLGDEQVRGERVLRDGDEVTLLTPIAGGEG